MRIPLLLALVLLLVAGCGDDPAPTAAGTTATAPGTASSIPVASPSPTRSAATAGSPAPGAASPTGSPRAAGTRQPVRLTGDGIDLPGRVAVFGDGFEPVRQALTAALGRPSRDSGEQSSFGSYGTCPGSRLRALEFGGGALRVLFGDVQGPALTMYQWSLSADGQPAGMPQASALVGDTSTFEFGVGTTLSRLRDGSAGAALDVQPGDEMLPASFRLSDQSAGFFGRLTGTADADTVTGVQAGRACGE